MEVLSVSPLRVGSLLWQTKPGAWALTVVCKATYALAPTESPLASEQEAPNEDDTYWNDDAGRSLHAATDLVPFKMRADVILVGHAFAPAKRPVRSLLTRMVIGDLDKSIEVFGDRHFTQDGKLHDGPPFARMSLAYEHASGGPGTSNPVGVRMGTRDAYGRVALPNLQPPTLVVASPADSFDPIGFGPVAPIWPSRREKLGRHANLYALHALLAGPLPEDIDPTFFNAAPLDQQIGELRDNERIVLENLHPEHPRLVTSLPGLRPRAFVAGRPGGPLALTMKADTLFIDTDRGLCSMIWRGSFQLEHAHERGRVVIGMEQPGQTLGWTEIERLMARSEGGGGAGAPVASSRAPRTDATEAKDPFHESTATYVGVDRGEPAVVKSTALPFTLQHGAESGSALASGSALSGPQASAPEEVEPDDDEVDPDGIKTCVETFLDPAMVASPLPFTPSPSAEPREPTAARLTTALPFTAPATVPRPGDTPSRPPVSTRPPLPPRPGVAPPVPPPLPATSAPPSVPPPVPAMGAPSTSVPAPPPLYIAESLAHWGNVEPPPPLGMPAAGAPLGGEAMSGWITPASVAVPAVPGASQPPPFRPPVPPAAAPPPVVESPWASGPPPAAFHAKPPILPMTPGPGPSSPQDGLQGLSTSKDAPDAAVLAASNAAAVKSVPWDMPRATTEPSGVDESAPEPQAKTRSDARVEVRDVIELLWLDAESVPRMRRQPPWRAILDDLENRAPDADIEETTPQRTTAEAENRRDVFEILARGSATEGGGINDALEKAIRDDGKFVPPVALVSGDLVFPFDEAEMLKAYMAAATPLASSDEHLRSAIALAKEFLSTPGLVGAPGVADGLIARIKEAFALSKRPVPADYLDTQTSRALLEKRCYQRRDLFGGTYLRCLFHTAIVTGASASQVSGANGANSANSAGGASSFPGAMPAYLPESLAKQLPLFQRFKVRMVAEVHLAVDQIETHPLGLKAAALARVVERPTRKGITSP